MLTLCYRVTIQSNMYRLLLKLLFKKFWNKLLKTFKIKRSPQALWPVSFTIWKSTVTITAAFLRVEELVVVTVDASKLTKSNYHLYKYLTIDCKTDCYTQRLVMTVRFWMVLKVCFICFLKAIFIIGLHSIYFTSLSLYIYIYIFDAWLGS